MNISEEQRIELIKLLENKNPYGEVLGVWISDEKSNVIVLTEKRNSTVTGYLFIKIMEMFAVPEHLQSCFNCTEKQKDFYNSLEGGFYVEELPA